ncbi:MAG: fatty acid desaturase [Rhodospirillales bacterium]|nr:fatty acid desaturase [Rhodospirillales bacterium]
MMFLQLPPWLQPFLTWLTARPAPGEAVPPSSPQRFVTAALACSLGGAALTAWALERSGWALFGPLPLGLLLTSSGLGLLQVVVFHHCAHGTVFRDRARNRLVGRAISALLLFRQFDAYQRGHMLHHSPRKLLTAEDEFADFVFAMCGLHAGTAKRALWRRVLANLVSPGFHARFLWRRLHASLGSADRAHNAFGIAAWACGFAAAAASGRLVGFLVAWVLPVTVLLQVATVFRILCEHRFPAPALIAARGKEFICRATAGVFPGAMPPHRSAASLHGLLAWTWWWVQMLTVQLFVRLFVLVGDAPCHDFHHRRPATRRWTGYIQARQQDVDAGCPGFPLNYQESWGLFRAIDENLATLAATPPGAVG